MNTLPTVAEQLAATDEFFARQAEKYEHLCYLDETVEELAA
jgi:hypothetical protein